MSLWWVFLLLLLSRLIELRVAERNRKTLLANGGREFFPETYKSVLTLHILFFLALVVESAPWWIPLNSLTIFCLVVCVLLQIGRYWCVMSLGEFWTTRIIVIPESKVIKSGPYLFLRHPNYLIVVLELAMIPLLMRAPVTMVIFSIANMVILQQRIRLEEQALREETDYSVIFS